MHLPSIRREAILARFRPPRITSCKANKTAGDAARSAERGEVEIHGDGIAFAGSDFDAGGVGLERGRRELEVHDGAGEDATTLGARVLRLAGDVLRGDLFVAVEDAIFESAPKFRGTQLNRGRSA